MQWPQAFQDKVYMGLKSIEESVKLSSGEGVESWRQFMDSAKIPE